MKKIDDALDLAHAIEALLSDDNKKQVLICLEDLPLDAMEKHAIENNLELKKPTYNNDRYNIFQHLNNEVTVLFKSERMEMIQSFRKKKTDAVEASV